MRVALVSEHASPLAVLGGADAGGQNAHVAALAAGLAARGVQVVVHTRRDDPDMPRRVRMARGVVVDHVPAGPAEPIPKDKLLPYMDEFAADLRRRWTTQRPDVAHSHFWMSGYATVKAARPLGIPVLHTFHALGVVKKREQGVRDTSPPERSELETGLLSNPYHGELDRQGAGSLGVDRILATCPDEVFELLRLGADRERVTVVPCGVDVSLFTPDGAAASRVPEARDREARAGGTGRILYVGRLVERKGIGNLITALADVPGAELVIAGGPDPARLDADTDVRRLQALAGRYQVRDRVRFLGRVDHAELPALYRSADVVACVPWYEPFGIVAVEAMACGVPVVVAAVGGLADTVIHNATGLHVPPRQPEMIAAALRRLLDDPVLRQLFGTAGRARAVRHYAMDRVVTSTLRAYAATMASSVRMAPELRA
jgi:D-inositol-3-phosphate glycosyltransferase